MELERMFSAHYFFSLKSEDLNHAFENSLQKILVSKTLSKEEFLPFAFFVTRYLADGSILPDENTLQIISHLIEITNQYYDDNKTDDSKIESITSTIFDNYTKIFGKLRKVFVVTFTNNNTSSGLLMKDEYVKGGVVIIDQGLKNSLAKIIDLAKADKKDKINVLSLKNLNV